MKHKTLFTAGSIGLGIFGFLCLVAPSFGLSLFSHDIATTDPAAIVTRYWGSAFIGISLILYMAREGQVDSIGVRAIIYGGFALCITGLAAALNDVFAGTTNALIWLMVALYAIFSVGFGYFIFKKTT